MTNTKPTDISINGVPEFKWTKLLGSSSNDSGRDLATGNDGSIYIAGETSGDLDGQTNNGNSDTFISKYNPDGTKEWTKLLGSSSNDNGYALTIGNDESIYIAGETSGDLDGQVNNSNSSSFSDAFISKYNPDGTKEWTKLLGSSSSDAGLALTTGNDGSIYIAGYTSGDLDGQTNNGNRDAFISKYNPDGTKEWTKLLDSSTSSLAHTISTGSDGSIYIAGEAAGDLDGQTTNNGNTDAFVSKYNPDGTKDWTRLLGSWNIDSASGVTTGSDGSIYIAGISYDDIDGLVNNALHGAFISKYDVEGEKQWTQLLSSATSTASDVTIGNDGSIYISGSTWGNLDDEINNSDKDAFISKFTSNGEKQWTRILGSNTMTTGNAIITGLDGSLFISGHTYTENINNNLINKDAFISKLVENTNLLNENIANESLVGYLSTTDQDSSTFNYELVRGTGDTDNSEFTILDNELKINSSPDYETQSSYNIRLKTTDSGSLSYEEEVTFTVNDVNEVATDISLSSTSFNENINSGSVVAILSTTDEDESDTHTYELVSGNGDTDNSSFTIEGSNLKINSSPDYETQSSYNIRLKTTDSGSLSYEEEVTFNVNDLVDTGILIANINETFSQHSKGFSSISGSAPVTVTAYEVGTETTLDSIKDYDGNLHAGDKLEETTSSYKYQGMLDVNGDGVFEAIFTNKVSKRWVTAKVDSTTGQVDFDDNGAGGGTRVVGIYEDPLIAVGADNGGFLSDGVTPAPANFGVSDADRYVEVNGETIDRLALNSQVRFQNDLEIDNLEAKHSGDYDSDGIHEVYWKTADGTAYLRSLMHADGNIRYANYQSEEQMKEYLTANGDDSVITDITS